ncbi:MAG: PEP-CTERM sorting domain-containing protein [Phycisphaerales bacterium]|jgi:hypothetical protein|nr:PEP-CTERM sorting domain-containing protein [Phycisphaerales bacterium]
MNRLSHNLLSGAFALTLLGGTGIASATVWDFQSDTVGSAPTNGVLYSDIQPSTQVEVVNSSSAHADPFGGSGNQSLWMEDSGQSNSTLTFNLGGPGVTQGTLSAKIYVVDDPSNTYQYIDLNGGVGNANTGVGDIGPWIQYDPQVFGFRAITSSGLKYFTNTVPHNSVIDLVIQFDATTDTFTGTINGNPLTDGTNTTFDFFNSLSDLSSVRIVHASSVQTDPSQSTTFYDNVTLAPVPEPSGMMILGLGSLALIRRKRRA